MFQQDFDFGPVSIVGKMERRRGSFNSRKNGADDCKDAAVAHHIPHILRDCKGKNKDNMMSPSLMRRNSLENGSQGNEISGLDHQLLSMEKSATGRFNRSNNTNDASVTNTGCLSCSRHRRDDYAGNDFGECHQQQQKKRQNQLQKKQHNLDMCRRQVERASPLFQERSLAASAKEIDTLKALSLKAESAFSNRFFNQTTSSSSFKESIENITSTSADKVSRKNTSHVSKCRHLEKEAHFFSGLSRAIWIQLGMFIFLTLNLQGISAVHIDSLSVPGIVRNGTEESVILDCDYSYEDYEKNGLVVKWYLSNSLTTRDSNIQKAQVYQWIPNTKPISLGILKGKLNLDYQADGDEYKKKRALQIIRPTTELSGTWMCKVSSFEGEATRAARMIVFAPEEEMDMRVVENRRGRFVNISCWATRVSPKPIMTFYNEEQQVQDVVVKYEEFEDNVFDVTAYKIIEDSTLSSMIGSVFDCELAIPSVNYVRRRTTVFEPGSLELKDAMWMSTGQPRVSWGMKRGFLSLAFLITLKYLML